MCVRLGRCGAEPPTSVRDRRRPAWNVGGYSVGAPTERRRKQQTDCVPSRPSQEGLWSRQSPTGSVIAIDSQGQGSRGPPYQPDYHSHRGPRTTPTPLVGTMTRGATSGDHTAVMNTRSPGPRRWTRQGRAGQGLAAWPQRLSGHVKAAAQ